MMDYEEFLSLLWRLEEMLMQLDYFRNQIGNCPNKCESNGEADDEGLCPTCCEWFEKVLAEDERLGKDTEFDEVTDKLKKACEEDETGRYQRILEQSRQAKIVH